MTSKEKSQKTHTSNCGLCGAPSSNTQLSQLSLNRARGLVPGHYRLAEVGLVGHVAGGGGVVSEDGVLDHWLAGANGFEEVPQVRLHVVIGWPGVGDGFGDELVSGLGIVLLVPVVFVGFAH